MKQLKIRKTLTALPRKMRAGRWTIYQTHE
jgi:hypothetical protein